VEKNGFGFMRGKLPKSEAYFDIDEKEYPDSRNIMLRVTSEGADGFKLTPVPGLHVVAGSNKAEYWDALSAFQNMLRLGFHGGPNCNVNLADSDPQHTLKNFRYPENPSMDKSVTTVRSGIEGDEYAYLLWSGFTSNYLPTSEVDMHVNPYGQGTVAHCPPSRFEPYIILVSTQITDFEFILLNPVFPYI